MGRLAAEVLQNFSELSQGSDPSARVVFRSSETTHALCRFPDVLQSSQNWNCTADASQKRAMTRLRQQTSIRLQLRRGILYDARAQHSPRCRPRSPEGPAVGYQLDTWRGVRSKRTDGG